MPLKPNLTVRSHLTTDRQAVELQFKKFILAQQYPCLGAKSTFRNDAYRFGHYETLGALSSAQALAADLLNFIHIKITMAGDFATFVAIFNQPTQLTEEAFESLLWQQLSHLHQEDHCPWAASADQDPGSNSFGFSFGGEAFFIVGLHAQSTRLARQFSRPTLVFNAHSQFEHLRTNGKFEKMQQVIRKRDKAWQGTINPMLANYGTASEARQYSGRAVPNDWQCPFLHHNAHP